MANIADRNYKPEWRVEEKYEKILAKYLELIKRMTSLNPGERPTTGEILRHFDTKEYFPIYNRNPSRPGLCVIFHQDKFNPVSIIKYLKLHFIKEVLKDQFLINVWLKF